MDFIRDPIYNVFHSKHGVKSAIQQAFDNQCYGAALVLLFSAIDMMGNLDRPEGQIENTDTDFKNWAGRYMSLPDVSVDDLWAARNAVIHTYTADSRAFRKKKAKRILWAVGEGWTVPHPADTQLIV